MFTKHDIDAVAITYGDLQLVANPQDIVEFDVFGVQQNISFADPLVSGYSTANYLFLEISRGFIREIGSAEYVKECTAAATFDSYYYGIESPSSGRLLVSVHFKPNRQLSPIQIDIPAGNRLLDGQDSGTLTLSCCTRCRYVPECRCEENDFRYR
ncbi:hypothetical protein [Bacillus phage SDFMU_Pbc]|uniref:Uncharacterized protein n=1 Tax=Bacillus phage SDFMU_Pbc TaxID=3076135 RepID=A0AA96R5S3_9CAUD|nr:hypothetical protein [Bacillus phage SDFMU_Pbc]